MALCRSARAANNVLRKSTDDPNRPVLFETGYGPSGLPHIGTFAEVVRTSMVRRAFEVLTGRAYTPYLFFG